MSCFFPGGQHAYSSGGWGPPTSCSRWMCRTDQSQQAKTLAQPIRMGQEDSWGIAATWCNHMKVSNSFPVYLVDTSAASTQWRCWLSRTRSLPWNDGTRRRCLPRPSFH